MSSCYDLMFFVMFGQKESPVDERSFSPSLFDSIHSSSVAEPQQLKMNVSTGRLLYIVLPHMLVVKSRLV